MNESAKLFLLKCVKMRSIMKRMLLLLTLGLPLWAGADTTVTFPPGCQLFSVQLMDDGSLQLPRVSTPYLLLVNNVGPYPLWVVSSQQAVTQLSKQRWAALIVQQEDTTLGCIEIKPGSEQYVSCEQTIQACVYPSLLTADSTLEAGWLVEDRNLYDLLSHVVSRGINLPSLAPGMLAAQEPING